MRRKSKIIRTDPDFIKEMRKLNWGTDATTTKRLATDYLPYIRTGQFMVIKSRKKKKGGFDFIP